MPTYRGYWVAKVKQEFEIEAENEAELDNLMGNEMHPANVVELYDFDYTIEATDDE